MSIYIKKPKLAVLPLAISAILTGTQAFADEGETSHEIEKIAVVGKTTNTEITPEILEQIQALDLEDIFRQTPSVTVGGGIGIAQKIFVRGLEDNMLNVTVDGAPQTSTLFHHTGRLSIEPELLKQVDVQAGAGEATSGFGAVGGAIRFKTKTADDLLTDNHTFGGKVKASYFTNDGHKESVSLYGKVTDKVGVLASYVTTERENYKEGDDTEILGTASDQSLAFLKINSHITDNQKLTVSHEIRKEDGKFPKQTNWSPIVASEFIPTWLDRDTTVANYSFFHDDKINLEVTIYHTASELKRELYTWSGKITTTGFDIRNTSDFTEHSLTYGIERRQDKLLAQSYSDVFGGVYKEEANVTGIYLQDHWQVFDDVLLSFGVRKDKYELDHNAHGSKWMKIDGVWTAEPGEHVSFTMPTQDGISKNIGVVYNITPQLSINTGYAEALRGRQTTDSFIVGELKGLNQDLQPEKVKNKEIGLEYNDGTYVFEMAAYSSEIEDVVFDKFKGDVIYENVGDLKSQGFEVVAGYQSENFDVLISYNNNDVELNNAPFIKPDANSPLGYSTQILNGVDLEAYEFGHLGNTVGDSINLAFNYQFNEQFETGFNVNFVKSVNDIEVFHRSMELGWTATTDFVNKPSYRLVDIYARYQFTENLGLDFAVQNLLDESYLSHGSVANYGHIAGYDSVVGFKEPGRDVRISVSYQF